MKKLLLVFIFSSIVNISVFPQAGDRRFTIQTSPMLWFLNLFSLMADKTDPSAEGEYPDYLGYGMDLEGQYKINNMFNISLTPSFQVRKTSSEPDFQINLRPMLVYRPFETGLKGFYAGIYPTIGWLSLNTGNKKIKRMELGLGLTTGYKWIFNNGFSLQLGTGIGRTWGIPNKHESLSINSDGSVFLERGLRGKGLLKNFNLHAFDFIKLGYSF